MVLLIEINNWKIPLPFTGGMAKLALHTAGKLDRKSAKQLWKALQATSRKFPDWTLVEVEEAGGETVRVSLRSLSLRKPGRRLFGKADGEKDLHFPGNCAILKEK